MKSKDDGGPAFPNYFNGTYHGGMSLRDWFAGMALHTELDQEDAQQFYGAGGFGLAAELAYAYADAMLAERNKDASD